MVILVSRPVKIAIVQTGPATIIKEENIKSGLKLVDQAAKEEPDFVVFPELFTTISWCHGTTDMKYFDWAEPIPGPTIRLYGEKAKEYGCYIIVPIFERGPCEGEYYNSAALIDPSGDLVYGTLPEGTKVKCYRKNHLSRVAAKDLVIDEPFYMKMGPGLPVFQTKKVTIGILICRDRMFPEAWRVLALQGAEIIFVPMASSGLWKEPYILGMRNWAYENQVFAVGCNRGGLQEFMGKKAKYFGLSCICSPSGSLIAKGPEDEGPAVIGAEIDLAEIPYLRRSIGWYRDRRPEIYGLICNRV